MPKPWPQNVALYTGAAMPETPLAKPLCVWPSPEAMTGQPLRFHDPKKPPDRAPPEHGLTRPRLASDQATTPGQSNDAREKQPKIFA